MVVTSLGPRQRAAAPYSVMRGAREALAALWAACRSQLPPQFIQSHRGNLSFRAPLGDEVLFPCALKEQEAASAIKALEGLAAACIADLRQSSPLPLKARAIEVDVNRASCFLMSAYLCTIDGMDKAHPEAKSKLIDTDLHQAQSVLYRRLAANLYETRTAGEYYHIHGSLEADTTLAMIGLPPHNPELCDYKDCINTIEAAVKRFSVAELEELNHENGQAGVPALKSEQFQVTPHGQALLSLPPLSVASTETSTPATPFAPQEFGSSTASSSQCLKGIRVLELCRVIAGPSIGRSLAAHGASVLKVTSPYLPDVPFFQVDVNTGKHATSLHLQSPPDRETFEALLASADVILDGYRPGALDRLGYGSKYLAGLAGKRGKGFIYVAEDCFGGTNTPLSHLATWASRPGWQQIADCATGVAWEQGRFMGLEEPVVPPFPMSDYGTGALGCVAAMAGLFRRATEGGSWECRTSLCQYDMFLLSLGRHSLEVQRHLRMVHDEAFFNLRHNDSVDEVGRRALQSMKRLHPAIFEDNMMMTAWSDGYQAEVKWPKEALSVEGLKVGHVRATRPNGFDAPTWYGWEEDEGLTQSA